METLKVFSPQSPMNTKWLILEYLRLRGAYDPGHAVSRKEILEALKLNPKTLTTCAHRMHTWGWLNAFPKHYHRFYWLGWKAKKFLREYPDFLHHPYFEYEG